MAVNALSGFDLLGVTDEARDMFCINTVFGVFRLRGAPQGFINTPSCFQQRIQSCVLKCGTPDSIFETPGNGVLQWLDDSILYSQSFSDHYTLTPRYLQNCAEYGVRLNLSKCVFVDSEVEWCGRLVTSTGVQFKQHYFEKILAMGSPRSLGDIEDLVYLSTWLSSSIPRLSAQRAVFSDLMVAMQQEANAGRRRRLAIIMDPAMEEDVMRTIKGMMDLVDEEAAPLGGGAMQISPLVGDMSLMSPLVGDMSSPLSL